jgi:hypothetical protein
MTTSSGVSVIRYPTSVEVAVIGFVRINMNIVQATSRSRGSRANYVSSRSHISGLFPFLRLHLAPSK